MSEKEPKTIAVELTASAVVAYIFGLAAIATWEWPITIGAIVRLRAMLGL